MPEPKCCHRRHRPTLGFLKTGDNCCNLECLTSCHPHLAGFGRGPTKAKTEFAGLDVVVCTLEDSFTPTPSTSPTSWLRSDFEVGIASPHGKERLLTAPA